MARSGRKGRKNQHLQLAYIKRRSSLLKTANQICTLTGSKMIIMEQHPDSEMQLMEIGRNENMEELNRKYADLMCQIKEEKKREAQLEEKTKAMKEQGLWGEEMDDELDANQLIDLIALIQEHKKKILAAEGDGGFQ